MNNKTFFNSSQTRISFQRGIFCPLAMSCDIFLNLSRRFSCRAILSAASKSHKRLRTVSRPEKRRRRYSGVLASGAAGSRREREHTVCVRKWNQEDCKETNARPEEKERNAACNFSDVRKRKEMAYAEGEDGLIIYTERPTGANAIINGPTCARAR